MPQEKKTSEERLEKAKLHNRRRYERIKSDPALSALEKEKSHQRYLKRKEHKKILSINEMTPSAKSQQRKKWRENNNKYYQRKMLKKHGIEMMKDKTPSCSDNEKPLQVDETVILLEEDHNSSQNPVQIEDRQLTSQVDESPVAELKKRATGRQWIEKGLSEGSLAGRPRVQPPRALTAAKDSEIESADEENPFINTSEQFNCSTRTIRRSLKREGVRYKEPAKKKEIKKQKKKSQTRKKGRVRFAREFRDYDFSCVRTFVPFKCRKSKLQNVQRVQNVLLVKW